MECNNEGVLRFDGMIVFDNDGIRWWTGVNDKGLKSFIERHINDDKIDVKTFKIYKNGEFIETIGDYINYNFPNQ